MGEFSRTSARYSSNINVSSRPGKSTPRDHEVSVGHKIPCYQVDEEDILPTIGMYRNVTRIMKVDSLDANRTYNKLYWVMLSQVEEIEDE